jgi:hypothetical protein
MLASERASVRQHEIGGIIHKVPELLHAGSGLQIERNATMNAAVTKMPKQCSSATWRTASQITPGWTVAVRLVASRATMRRWHRARDCPCRIGLSLQ